VVVVPHVSVAYSAMGSLLEVPYCEGVECYYQDPDVHLSLASGSTFRVAVLHEPAQRYRYRLNEDRGDRTSAFDRYCSGQE